jgi:hypothetical protein
MTLLFAMTDSDCLLKTGIVHLVLERNTMLVVSQG